MMLMVISLSVLVASVILYVLLMTVILPKAMLKVVYKVDKPKDRGTKKCIFDGKHCMVYTSTKENKQFIKQYVLLQEEGHKTLTCKLTPVVKYIDYDIVLFNRYNKAFKVINVKEDISSAELTRATMLPDETAYVNIVVRKVNHTSLKKAPTVKMKKKSISLFALVVALITAVEGFVIRSCCSYSFGGVFRESFIASYDGLIALGALAILTGIIASISVSLTANKKARK